MADVVRFVRDIQEVVYTVGPDTVRKAILRWLHEENEAAFTDETTIRFCAGDAIAVTTRFAASADTLPKGQDAQQGLAGTESGAVGVAETPKPSRGTDHG